MFNYFHRYHVFNVTTESEVPILHRKDLWIVIDDIYELGVLFTCQLCLFHTIEFKWKLQNFNFKLKVSATIIWSKSDTGFSSVTGVEAFVDFTSTCSVFTLILSGGTGWNELLIQLSLLSIIALCSNDDIPH